MNNLRLLALKKESSSSVKVIRFSHHQQTQRLHQTTSHSHRQSAATGGRKHTYILTMGSLCRMVFVVSYTDSQLSFRVVWSLWDTKFQRVQFRVWSSVLWHCVSLTAFERRFGEIHCFISTANEGNRRPKSVESRKKIRKKREIYPAMWIHIVISYILTLAYNLKET